MLKIAPIEIFIVSNFFVCDLSSTNGRKVVLLLITTTWQKCPLITPDHFQFNYQTGETNSFQQQIVYESVTKDAKDDFNNIEQALIVAGVRIITMASPPNVLTPDAVFPNNWFSFHNDDNKTVLVLYPMLNLNRQAERQTVKLTETLAFHNILFDELVDLTYFEKEGKALEGTGSLVLDRDNKIAYASISPRMHVDILNVFCAKMNYSPVVFASCDARQQVIYHTNVMMSVGRRFAVICLDSITNEIERMNVLAKLHGSNKTVITISLEQINNMCGNILEIKSKTTGKSLIAMSTTAFNAFTAEQIEKLQLFGDIIHSNINTIETIGGGSVRCMLAEIFYI